MCQQELEILEIIEITQPSRTGLPIQELYVAIIVERIPYVSNIARARKWGPENDSPRTISALR
jgi:hypothetical protein